MINKNYIKVINMLIVITTINKYINYLTNNTF